MSNIRKLNQQIEAAQERMVELRGGDYCEWKECCNLRDQLRRERDELLDAIVELVRRT